ncbi:MAG: class I tRNA ligase family protein [Arenimonas sp.]
MNQLNPIDGNGRLPAGHADLLLGNTSGKANDTIVDLLRENGSLLADAKLQHSYPHCWRHKRPSFPRHAAVVHFDGPGRPAP